MFALITTLVCKQLTRHKSTICNIIIVFICGTDSCWMWTSFVITMWLELKIDTISELVFFLTCVVSDARRAVRFQLSVKEKQKDKWGYFTNSPAIVSHGLFCRSIIYNEITTSGKDQWEILIHGLLFSLHIYSCLCHPSLFLFPFGIVPQRIVIGLPD